RNAITDVILADRYPTGDQSFSLWRDHAARAPRMAAACAGIMVAAHARSRRLDEEGLPMTKSALRNCRRPPVAQAFRPANGRRGSPEGLRYRNFATRAKHVAIAAAFVAVFGAAGLRATG